MANLNWGLFTLANFTVPKAFGAGSEGPDQLALGSVLTSVVNAQVIIGTALVDQISTGGFTGVNITGAGENDVFTVTAGSTATVITDLNTGDQFNVTDSSAGGASALAATTTGFTASALTTNTHVTGGANTVGSVALTAAAAGATINMSLAGGNLGYTINGGGAADTLVGSMFADTINGGGVASTITGGPGADTITGGAGNDTFVINTGDAAAGESITGGGGTDIVQVNATTTFSSVTLNALWTWNLASGVTATITGPQFVAAAIKTVIGVAGGATETLVINAASGVAVDVSTITTVTSASLTLNGADGNEALTGAATSTTINGGAGNDTIVGGAAADTLSAGAGTDSITGAAGADAMTAGSGVDTFVISTVTDSVAPSATTFAGANFAAADTITFGNGVDVINSFTAGAGGDVLDLNQGSAAVTGIGVATTALVNTVNYFLSGSYAAGVFTIAADGVGVDTLIIQGASNANITANTASIVLVGVDTDNLVAANIM